MGDDGSEGIEVRRKRLRYRSWNRGLKETDLILGRFADRHLPGFDAWHLDRYEALLEESDPDIFAWVARREPLPERHDNAVLKLLLEFRFYDQ